MRFEDLLTKTLGEVLDEYSILCNYECGFIYGVVPNDMIPEIMDKYDVSEYPEAFMIDPIIDIELITDMGNEIITHDKVDKIMKNLGIKPKKTVIFK